MTTRLIAMLLIVGGAAGCSNDQSKLVTALNDLATNTNGRISVTLETGTWGTKGTFHFEDVGKRCFVTNDAGVEK